jgi:hypothetical protein
MGVDIYYFYHGFGLKAFEGRHIRMIDDSPKINYKLFKTSFQMEEYNFQLIEHKKPLISADLDQQT